MRDGGENSRAKILFHFDDRYPGGVDSRLTVGEADAHSVNLREQILFVLGYQVDDAEGFRLLCADRGAVGYGRCGPLRISSAFGGDGLRPCPRVADYLFFLGRTAPLFELFGNLIEDAGFCRFPSTLTGCAAPMLVDGAIAAM